MILASRVLPSVQSVRRVVRREFDETKKPAEKKSKPTPKVNITATRPRTSPDIALIVRPASRKVIHKLGNV